MRDRLKRVLPWLGWVLLLGGLALVALHRERVALVKLPPPELARWYKPDSERQAWLHNMFKLRRELQALRQHAEAGDTQRAAHWLGRLRTHYARIGEMVPDWQDRLAPGLLTRLQAAVDADRLGEVAPLLDELEDNCRACHAEYRAVTALLYRAPDFRSLSADLQGRDVATQMAELGRLVNRIRIASEDGRPQHARQALITLRTEMQRLGERCTTCHEPAPAYPGPEATVLLETLARTLEQNDVRAQGRALGALAVAACARCHGSHRLAGDVRQALAAGPDWRSLLRH